MNIMFENTYTFTLERYLEYCNHPIAPAAKKQNRRWKTVNIVFMVIMLGNLAISCWMQRWMLAVISGALFLAFAYRFFIQRNQLIRKQYELIRSGQPEGEWIRKVQFTDVITVQDANNRKELAYSEIKQLTEDEQYFLLWQNEAFVLRLPKDSFTVGDIASFPGFIREKIAGK